MDSVCDVWMDIICDVWMDNLMQKFGALPSIGAVPDIFYLLKSVCIERFLSICGSLQLHDFLPVNF